MRSECEFCADLDKYNLDPAKPVTFTTYHFTKHGPKEVTKNMHKERNGVHFCLGVECRNQHETKTH